jgi:hypothetical protein
LFSAQDILDVLTGESIAKDQCICKLESLANLDADEKKKRVAIYNKKINKAMKELANSYRNKFALHKDLHNAVVGDEGMLDITKQQVKAVENIIKNSIPEGKIETALTTLANGEPEINIEEALSEESIKKSFATINIEES